MVLLCDGGLAINMLSSILMNGVCCLHNLSAEEERNRRQQEELRRTINVEYERQRLFDKECRDRMRREEQLLVEKQRLAAEQLLQLRRRGGGGVMLLCDEEHNNNNNNNNNIGSTISRSNDNNNAHFDAARHSSTIGRSAQSPNCPRRALMVKKLQLSSPVSSASMSSPATLATSVSPCKTSTSRPVDGCMGLIQDDQRPNGINNNSEGMGTAAGKRRYAYQVGWSDMMLHRRSARRTPQERDEMSSSCASSTVSLFDDSSDEEVD